MTKKMMAVNAAKKGFKRLTRCMEIASVLDEKDAKWVEKRLKKLAKDFEKKAMELAKDNKTPF